MAENLRRSFILMTVIGSSIYGLEIVTILRLLSKMSLFWRFEYVKKSFGSHMDDWLLGMRRWVSLKCRWFIHSASSWASTAVVPGLCWLRIHTVGRIGLVALSRDFALMTFGSLILDFSGNVGVSRNNFRGLALKAIDHGWRLAQTHFGQFHHFWLKRRVVQMRLLWRVHQDLLRWTLACCCLEQRYFNLHLVQSFGVLRVQLLHLVVLLNKLYILLLHKID